MNNFKIGVKIKECGWQMCWCLIWQNSYFTPLLKQFVMSNVERKMMKFWGIGELDFKQILVFTEASKDRRFVSFSILKYLSQGRWQAKACIYCLQANKIQWINQGSTKTNDFLIFQVSSWYLEGLAVQDTIIPIICYNSPSIAWMEHSIYYSRYLLCFYLNFRLWNSIDVRVWNKINKVSWKSACSYFNPTHPESNNWSIYLRLWSW